MTSNMTGTASRPRTEPTTERTSPSPRHSARKVTPTQSPPKPHSSSSEHDTDSAAGSATKMPSRNPIDTQPLKEMNPSTSANEYAPSYSYGKRENILSGREPKLPRALLEGRRSDRMVELKGRTYNEEDWFDDETTKVKVNRGLIDSAAKKDRQK